MTTTTTTRRAALALLACLSLLLCAASASASAKPMTIRWASEDSDAPVAPRATESANLAAFDSSPVGVGDYGALPPGASLQDTIDALRDAAAKLSAQAEVAALREAAQKEEDGQHAMALAELAASKERAHAEATAPSAAAHSHDDDAELRVFHESQFPEHDPLASNPDLAALLEGDAEQRVQRSIERRMRDIEREHTERQQREQGEVERELHEQDGDAPSSYLESRSDASHSSAGSSGAEGKTEADVAAEIEEALTNSQDYPVMIEAAAQSRPAKAQAQAQNKPAAALAAKTDFSFLATGVVTTDATTTHAEAETESESEAEGEAESDSESGGESEAESDSESDAESEADSESESEEAEDQGVHSMVESAASASSHSEAELDAAAEAELEALVAEAMHAEQQAKAKATARGIGGGLLAKAKAAVGGAAGGLLAKAKGMLGGAGGGAAAAAPAAAAPAPAAAADAGAGGDGGAGGASAGAGQWWLQKAPWFLPPPPEWGPMPVTMYTSYFHKPAPTPYHLDYAHGIPLPQAAELSLARRTYPQPPFAVQSRAATDVALAEMDAEASASFGVSLLETGAQAETHAAITAESGSDEELAQIASLAATEERLQAEEEPLLLQLDAVATRLTSTPTRAQKLRARLNLAPTAAPSRPSQQSAHTQFLLESDAQRVDPDLRHAVEAEEVDDLAHASPVSEGEVIFEMKHV